MESPELPADMKGLFRTTDECKPLDGGRKLLITSSGGAAVLVTREGKRLLFYGRAANAHSADLLPRGRIAVAASRDSGGRGDSLIIFDPLPSNRELWREPLPSGHGAVWDVKRRLLWALGDTELKAYQLRDWETGNPKLALAATVELPEPGGHDLAALGTTPLMTVTTGRRCWLFDRDKRSFSPHPTLSEHPGVKSISVHPVTGQLVYVQAEGREWWAERLRFLDPAKIVHTAGEHYYKARWVAIATTEEEPRITERFRPLSVASSSR